MNNEIELNYLRERNEVLLGRIEEYLMENSNLQRKVRELQIHIARLRHPSGRKDD